MQLLVDLLGRKMPLLSMQMLGMVATTEKVMAMRTRMRERARMRVRVRARARARTRMRLRRKTMMKSLIYQMKTLTLLKQEISCSIRKIQLASCLGNCQRKMVDDTRSSKPTGSGLEN
jgi:hypothetical protein